MKFALLALLLCIQLSALCGAEAPPGEYPVEFTGIGADGAPGTVTCILQDHLGFLWFGTTDGLIRFDGINFTNFETNSSDSTSISHNFIQCLFEDRNHNLWVGTLGGGLNRFQAVNETFARYQQDPDDPNSISDNSVVTVFEDKKGDLWIGTEHGGLNHFNVSKKVFDHFTLEQNSNSLSHNHVRSIIAAGDEKLFVFTQGGGVNLFDPQTRRFAHYRHNPVDPSSVSSDLIRSAVIGQNGKIWVGTLDGGLNSMEVEKDGNVKFKSYQYDQGDPQSLSSNAILSLFETSDGVLWIGTENGGLNSLSGDDYVFTRHQHDPKTPTTISSNSIWSIYQDREGTIWIGTFNQGLNKINSLNRKFSHFKENPFSANSLSNNNVSCFYQDRQGDFWIGTDGGGVNLWDRDNNKFVSYTSDPLQNNSLSSSSVLSLLEDRKGEFWVGTWGGGLNLIQRDNGRITHFTNREADPESLGNNFVTSILEDRQGRIWVGLFRGGLDLMESEGHFRHFQNEDGNPESLSSDLVFDLCEDQEGNLWVGTLGGGLNLMKEDADGNFVFERFVNDPKDPTSLSDNQINDIFADSKGRLWIGTSGGGLNQFNAANKSFQVFRKDDGLPSNSINSIIEDQQGKLWISSSKGLSLFNASTSSFRNFGMQDGLQGEEFMRKSSWRNADGELYFGGINGFNSFYPDEISDNPNIPPVHLTEIKIFNKSILEEHQSILEQPIPLLRELELSYKESVISFGFIALNYTHSSRNQYSYYLEGFDKEWIEAGTNRTATYTNLDPGRYTFRVRGSNNDGVWNENGTFIELVIIPPFWKTWWFLGLFSLFLIWLIVLAFKIRTRAILSQKKNLEEEVRSRTRDLEEKAEEIEKINNELGAKNTEMEQFIYTVSHDLKSPLSSIKGLLDLVKRDISGHDRSALNEELGMMDSSVDKMKSLVEDLLELSRAGLPIGEKVKTSFEEVVAEALDLLRARIESIDVEIVVDKHLPECFCDKSRIVQVIQNLVDNGIKFSQNASKPQINIGMERINGFEAFFVKDNGIGIDPKYQVRIFNVFDRVDDNKEGSGVGLSIVKKIVEAHNGRIWVKSEGKGLGSAFYFTLGKVG